jgi:hypothetical protein
LHVAEVPIGDIGLSFIDDLVGKLLELHWHKKLALQLGDSRPRSARLAAREVQQLGSGRRLFDHPIGCGE